MEDWKSLVLAIVAVLVIILIITRTTKSEHLVDSGANGCLICEHQPESYQCSACLSTMPSELPGDNPMKQTVLQLIE
jgi:competence protein ComGC